MANPKRVQEMSRPELERECQERGGKPELMLVRELRIWVQEARKRAFQEGRQHG